MTSTPLIERSLLGYPGIVVELIHNRKSDRSDVIVKANDNVATEWKGLTREEAKDRFFHPFCYGFNVRNELREGDESATG